MIELHVHLDGSLSRKDVAHLAELSHIPYEPGSVKLYADSSCQSLNDYLSLFDFPVKLLQKEECLEYAAHSLFSRLASQGVLYAEVRFAPLLSQEQGLSVLQASQAAIRGMEKAKEEKGILGGMILCLMRGPSSKEGNHETVLAAKELFGKGVVGLDLAGAEALYPTDEYREEFALAKSLGIPFTIHAGEADGPSSIWKAIEMGASRIGHGVRAVEDPALMEELAKRKITLELCPTSEVHTHAIASLDKLPLRKFLSHGIPCAISTDDMTVSRTTLEKEYSRLEETFGLTDEETVGLWKSALEASFAPKKEKEKLRERLAYLL